MLVKSYKQRRDRGRFVATKTADTVFFRTSNMDMLGGLDEDKLAQFTVICQWSLLLRKHFTHELQLYKRHL